MTTWLDIRDAWRGTPHVVQVRAQEEFGHGTWSEWSREAVGTPWTGRRGTCGPEAGGSARGPPASRSPLALQTPGTSPLKWRSSARRWDSASATGGHDALLAGPRVPVWDKGPPGPGGLPCPIAPLCLLLQFPVEDGTYWVTLPPELFMEDAADDAGGEEGALGWPWRGRDPYVPRPHKTRLPPSAAGAVVEASARSMASPYAFLVAGGSLLLGIALFVGIMVR